MCTGILYRAMLKKLGRKSICRKWFLPSPLSLYLCDDRGDRTGGHIPANKSSPHKCSNISPAITHDKIKSHIATCRSVKWNHEMGGTVPWSHLCTLLLLPLSILENNVLSSYLFLENGFYHFVKTYVGSLRMIQQALARYLLSLFCAKHCLDTPFSRWCL